MYLDALSYSHYQKEIWGTLYFMLEIEKEM